MTLSIQNTQMECNNQLYWTSSKIHLKDRETLKTSNLTEHICVIQTWVLALRLCAHGQTKTVWSPCFKNFYLFTIYKSMMMVWRYYTFNMHVYTVEINKCMEALNGKLFS